MAAAAPALLQPAPPAHAWTLFCDGSALPNPGRMGLGAVLIEPDGRRHGFSEATHSVGCNNEAELCALRMGVARALERGVTALRVFSDNSVLVEQLHAPGVPPIARLAPLFDAARSQLAALTWWRIEWIPRHRNGEADALARASLGLPTANATKAKHRAGAKPR